VRRFVVVVLALLLALVITDRSAWWIGQHELASQLQKSGRLGDSVDVSISGFPFLTQALGGQYQQVEVTSRQVPVFGGVAVDSVVAQLDGVHVDLSSALSGDVRAVPVDTLTVHARVSFASLGAALTSQSGDRLHVQFGYGGPDRVSLSGTVPTAAGGVAVRGTARLTLSGRTLSLVPDSASLAGLPSLVRDEALTALALRITVPDVFPGVRPSAVSVDRSGVQLVATGHQVVLRRLG
jgi:LmeA-like phospholipid-binding